MVVRRIRHFVAFVDNKHGVRKRVRFTPIYIVALLVVTTAWRVSGWPHHAARVLSAYRPDDLLSIEVLRIPPAALLLPNSMFYLGLPPLILVLYALERRIGALRLLVIVGAAHVAASVVGGIAVRLAHDVHTLHQLDVGSSVIMVSAAAALSAATRHPFLWVITIVGTMIDAILGFDLASLEHVVALITGSLVALAIVRRQSTARPALAR